MSLFAPQLKKSLSTGKEAIKSIGRMRRFLLFGFLAMAFLLLPAGSMLLEEASTSNTVPTIDILSVVLDESVTIRTANFPADTTFTATMGPMGTRGVDGTVVGTVDSGSGGSFDATFQIPDGLKGSYQISIRLQSSGPFPYFSYNWFYNNTTGTTVPPAESETPTEMETPTAPESESDTGAGGQPATTTPVTGTGPGHDIGSPVMVITSVVRDQSVTFQTNNYPPNQTFNVTMGPMGTKGINGTLVGSFNSGQGGSFEVTMPIPDAFAGWHQISIQAQTAHAYPYFSYNWFYNYSTS